MKRNSTFLLLLLGIVFLIFRQWIVRDEIIGGDWPYFFNETLQEFPFFPPAWSATHGNGLGGMIPAYFLDQYLYFTAFFTNTLNIPWSITYKIFWFGLFIILSIFSSLYLLRTIFNKLSSLKLLLGAFVYTANTYILMVVGGGQMGVALAYSLAPLVLARFLKIIHNSEFIIHNSVLAGLVLGIQLMFDPRIAYITMLAVGLHSLLFIIIYNAHKIYNAQHYMSLRIEFASEYKIRLGFFLMISIGISLLLNAYWLLPIMIVGQSPLPEGFTSTEGFKFFSFADFSHAISLLHPNWPENIFGKTYFLRPEFLILPILAFSSLLFLNSKFPAKGGSASGGKIQNNSLIYQYPNILISFFALLGLSGAFLAKGANPPFGEINQWLFQYVPGMNMFRDPTKFYLIIILSYTILIPQSLFALQAWLNEKLHRENNNIIIILFILFWLFLMKEGVFGQLGGTFAKREIPKEYIELKDFLYSQPGFSRTLWIPRQQRFTFLSNNHPSVEAIPLFHATNSAQIVSGLQRSESQRLLEELSVKYVIVPYDSLGEIFLKDRKYDEGQYEDTIREIRKVTWLKKLDGFGKIVVFEASNPEDHFWLDGQGKLSYKMISPTQYLLNISVPGPINLIFSESYSPYWSAKIDDVIINADRTSKDLNSFRLNRIGNYNMEVNLLQEQYYNYGRILSVVTLLTIVLLFLVAKSKKR